jgi:hypothetical protein
MATERVMRGLVFATKLGLGPVAFALIFCSQLARTPAERYTARDDAVITLSHARNLVEYGFIGASPSGERIEGFSAPLQFLTAAAVYAIAPYEYATFFRWQTLVGTIALGMAFGALLGSSGHVPVSRHRLAFIGVALIGCAQILACSSAFLWWHASGMENAYKSVALVALLYFLDGMLRDGRILWPVVLLVPLAAITRIDAVVPVAMLLAAFVALWWTRHGNSRALVFTVASLLPWVAFMAFRREYFGQWEPNTAAAQAISVAGRLATAARSPVDALLNYRAWFNDVGASLFAFQLLWLVPIGWLLRREAVAVNRMALIISGTAACIVQYSLFGPARMDPTRTVSELALYSTAAVPLVLLGTKTFTRSHFVLGTVALGSSVLLVMGAAPHQREIGWGTPSFEAVADFLDRIAVDQDLPRPLIANPDLGAVSWRKHFNIVDFGRLGSAIIPRVESPGAYIATVGEPDIVELHAPWSCFYRDLLLSPTFGQHYVRITPPDLRDAQCPGPTGTLPAYWVRRAIMRGSQSPERLFLDRFRQTLDVRLVEAELGKCLANPDPRPCGYVGRTLFRFAPELRRARREKEVAALLGRDRRLRIEHAFFTSSTNPQWWQAVVDAAPRDGPGSRR